MRLEHEDESVKYVYNENFWSGKKALMVNGVDAERVNKKEFRIQEDNSTGVIKGSFLTGVKLQLSTGKEIVFCQNKWYEWILIFMPVLSLGLGIFCGAIGGFLSALFGLLGAVMNATVVRSEMNIVFKVLCCIGIFALSFAAWFFIYALIAGGLAVAFPAIFS